jgi:hypothetical protein
MPTQFRLRDRLFVFHGHRKVNDGWIPLKPAAFSAARTNDNQCPNQDVLGRFDLEVKYSKNGAAKLLSHFVEVCLTHE